MDDEAQVQAKFMLATGAIGLRDLDHFTSHHPIERRQICRQVAEDVLRESGLPTYIGVGDWDGAAAWAVERMRTRRTAGDHLREAGVPLTADADLSPPEEVVGPWDGSRPAGIRTLRECNVPLRRGTPVPVEAPTLALGSLDFLREAGVPVVREATAAAGQTRTEKQRPASDQIDCRACGGLGRTTDGRCQKCDGTGMVARAGMVHPASTPSSVSTGRARTKQPRQRISDESVTGQRWAEPSATFQDADSASNGPRSRESDLARVSREWSAIEADATLQERLLNGQLAPPGLGPEASAEILRETMSARGQRYDDDEPATTEAPAWEDVLRASGVAVKPGRV
jgi:hypothetical protein